MYQVTAPPTTAAPAMTAADSEAIMPTISTTIPALSTMIRRTCRARALSGSLRCSRVSVKC